MHNCIQWFYFCADELQVRDELEQLLDEENDLADLYLSRKLSRASLLSGSVGASLYISSPHISSKISRASRASMESIQGDETNVEELEMLLEVRCELTCFLLSKATRFSNQLVILIISGLLYAD